MEILIEASENHCLTTPVEGARAGSFGVLEEARAVSSRSSARRHSVAGELVERSLVAVPEGKAL